MAKSQDTVLTIDELADYLKLSKSTLYHFARNRNVPGVKVGRHLRFHKKIIDRWLGENLNLARIQQCERDNQRGCLSGDSREFVRDPKSGLPIEEIP